MYTNEERGCKWQGEMNDINSHLVRSDGCQFENVNCPNECGMTLQRRYLTSHVDNECPCYKVNCQYCHIRGLLKENTRNSVQKSFPYLVQIIVQTFFKSET